MYCYELQEPAFRERDALGTGGHEMVEDSNIYEREGLLETGGEEFVSA